MAYGTKLKGEIQGCPKQNRVRRIERMLTREGDGGINKRIIRRQLNKARGI